MKEIGSTIIWKVKGRILGRMVAAMKVTTSKIKSMARVLTHGQMAANTQACGKMESRMV